MGALLQRLMKRYRCLLYRYLEERCNQIYPTPQCNLVIEWSRRFCYVTSLASLTRPFPISTVQHRPHLLGTEVISTH